MILTVHRNLVGIAFAWGKIGCYRGTIVPGPITDGHCSEQPDILPPDISHAAYQEKAQVELLGTRAGGCKEGRGRQAYEHDGRGNIYVDRS